MKHNHGYKFYIVNFKTKLFLNICRLLQELKNHSKKTVSKGMIRLIMKEFFFKTNVQ